MQFRSNERIVEASEVNRMPVTLASIKAELDQRVGDEVVVIAQAGRKKITKRHGVLSETYPAVFIVNLNQDENAFERVSYSYTDLLTKNIEIDFNFEEHQDTDEDIEDVE